MFQYLAALTALAPMQVQLTRDSVAMSDDCDAPHQLLLPFPDDASLADIVGHVFCSCYLAQIAGGQATWTAVTHRPVAVLAQQWPAPKMMPSSAAQTLELTNGILHLHFRYYAQQDPDLVYQQLLGTTAT